MFEMLYYGIMKIAIWICLIISPFFSIGFITGLLDWRDIYDDKILMPIVFHLITIIDIGLLAYKFKDWIVEHKKALIAVLCCAAILAALPFMIDSGREYMLHTQVRSLIENKQYEQAAQLLSEIEDIHKNEQAYAFLNLCKAHMYNDAGDIGSAESAAITYNLFISPANRLPEEEDFVQRLRTSFHEGYEAEKERKRQAENEAYERKIGSGVPFVGMPESRINDTVLGSHCGTVRHDTEIKNGKRYTANLYDFERSGKTIFTARCVDGTVTRVWDKRNQSSSGTSASSRYKSSLYSYDYDLENYWDAEDFYYDYYDDFESYEDAEDYFFEYGY